jgi:hypothetical protein
VASLDPLWSGLTPDAPGHDLAFEPHRGWLGHIERSTGSQTEHVSVAELQA